MGRGRTFCQRTLWVQSIKNEQGSKTFKDTFFVKRQTPNWAEFVLSKQYLGTLATLCKKKIVKMTKNKNLKNK